MARERVSALGEWLELARARRRHSDPQEEGMVQRLCVLSVLALFAGFELRGQVCSMQSYPVSPETGNGARAVILQTIEAARLSLDIALSSFTDVQLGDAVVRAFRRGLSVRVILATAGQVETGSQYKTLATAEVPMELAPTSALFSHHFAVVDGAIVITGSYEWADLANPANYGSVILIRCPSSTANRSTADEFAGEFARLWELFRGEQATIGASETSSALVGVTIQEVDRAGQCIQLLNLSSAVVDIGGWAISDFEGRYVFPQDTELAPGDPYRVCLDTFNPMHDTLGLYLDSADDEIFLVTHEGSIVDEVVW
jgi:hypothetical protein